MKSYDLNLLKALDALLESASVTVAAERMHLSVPAMSHTLARLRELMGDPILVRAGRKLVPTPRALELKEPVARLLDDARALIDQPGSRDLMKLQRAFVVRAPDGISVAFGAPMAAAFQEVMPNSTLHFVPEAHGDTGALREGRIDLDIGSFRLKDPEIEITELSRQAQLGAVAAGHALGSGRSTAKRYAAQSHVAVMQRPREGSPVDDALAALGLRRFVALTVPSAYASLVVAARSSLVATVPERIARIMAPALGLTLFDLPFELARQPVVMAWHPRHSAEPAHTWLRQLVQRLLSDSTWLATPLPLPEGAPPVPGATHA